MEIFTTILTIIGIVIGGLVALWILSAVLSTIYHIASIVRAKQAKTEYDFISDYIVDVCGRYVSGMVTKEIKRDSTEYAKYIDLIYTEVNKCITDTHKAMLNRAFSINSESYIRYTISALMDSLLTKKYGVNYGTTSNMMLQRLADYAQRNKDKLASLYGEMSFDTDKCDEYTELYDPTEDGDE